MLLSENGRGFLFLLPQNFLKECYKTLGERFRLALLLFLESQNETYNVLPSPNSSLGIVRSSPFIKIRPQQEFAVNQVIEGNIVRLPALEVREVYPKKGDPTATLALPDPKQHDRTRVQVF